MCHPMYQLHIGIQSLISKALDIPFVASPFNRVRDYAFAAAIDFVPINYNAINASK
jgi:hypothetical protein